MHRSTLDQNFRRYCRRGDVGALGAAFDEAAPELLQVARRLVGGDEALAEDVVQAVFLTALEKASAFDRKRRVMPWLVGFLAVEVQRERARAGRVPNPAWLEEDAEARASLDPEAAAENEELRRLVEEKVEELPETYRSAIRGHLFGTEEAGTVAQRLGITPGALHVRIHRGLKLLRGALPAGAALTAGLTLARPRGLESIRTTVCGKAGVMGAGAGAAAAAGGGLSGSSVALAVAAASGLVLGGAAVATLGFNQGVPGPGDVILSTDDGGSAQGPTQPSPGSLKNPDQAAAALIPPSAAEAAPGGGRRILAPSLATPESAPGASTRDAEYWLGEFATADTYNEIMILGGRLKALPGDQCMEVLREIFPQLELVQRQQIAKAFVFNETDPNALHVLDLQVRDGDERVRSRGWSYLKQLALQDFSTDPEAYSRWREQTQDLPLSEVVAQAASEFAARAASASGEELLSILSAAVVPTEENLFGIGIELDRALQRGGLTAALPRWLTSEDPVLVGEALRWAAPAKLDDAALQTFIAPLLWDERDRLPKLSAYVLAQSRAPFAPSLLAERFGSGSGATEDELASIDYWRQWTAPFR